MFTTILLLTATLGSFAGATVPPDCAALLAPLEAEFESRAKIYNGTQAEYQRVEGELKHLLSGMNWKERNLTPWLAKALGGSEFKLIDREVLKNTQARLSEERLIAHTQFKAANQAVLDAASYWLRANDREFAAKQEEHRLLCELANTGARCLAEVDQAIAAVTTAKRDDLMAGVSDNKILEAIAYSDTQKAKAAIETARLAVTNYIQRLNSVQHSAAQLHGVISANHIVGVDGGIQFAVNLISGNSVMDWVNMYRLGSIKTELEAVRQRVASAHQNVESARLSLEHAIDQLLAALRAEAKAPPKI